MARALSGRVPGHRHALQELSSDEVLVALRIADVGIVADHVDTTDLPVHTWDRPFVGLSSDTG